MSLGGIKLHMLTNTLKRRRWTGYLWSLWNKAARKCHGPLSILPHHGKKEQSRRALIRAARCYRTPRKIRHKRWSPGRAHPRCGYWWRREKAARYFVNSSSTIPRSHKNIIDCQIVFTKSITYNIYSLLRSWKMANLHLRSKSYILPHRDWDTSLPHEFCNWFDAPYSFKHHEKSLENLRWWKARQR